MPEYDVLCIGNAIVDIIAQCDEAFLTDNGIIKGAMNLIDAERAELLYTRMGPASSHLQIAAVALGHQLIAPHTRDASRRFAFFDREGWSAGWDIGAGGAVQQATHPRRQRQRGGADSSRSAAPGGSARPAADYSKRQRGDGAGKAMNG